MSKSLGLAARELLLLLEEPLIAGPLATVQRGRVLVLESRVEEGRTIEIQVLDDDGDELQICVASDGNSGSLCMMVIRTAAGYRTTMPPTQIVDGVPTLIVEPSS
jgi:hypothetical protein